MKITIFGVEGTGTSSVGKMLAEMINYSFKSSGGIMRDMADKEGLTLEQFNTNRHKVVKESNDDSSDREIDEYIKDFGVKNDNFIFESRLAWYLIPDSFKIKLVCDEEISAERVANREGINQEESKKNNKRRSMENKEVYEFMYKDINYPPEDEVFDLVIDTSNISIDEVINNICKRLDI